MSDYDGLPFSSVCYITLEEAFKVLEECSALSTEDGELFYPNISDLVGDDKNTFAYFAWKDDDGLNHIVKFAEGENQLVAFVHNLMKLVDSEGNEFNFYVLAPMDIKEFIDSTRHTESVFNTQQATTQLAEVPPYSSQSKKAALELVDGAYDIIEIYKAESPAQIAWKQAWLAKAKELGATSD